MALVAPGSGGSLSWPRIPTSGGLRRCQRLAIAAAMAAACALPPIPMHGARHRGGLFSIALNALSEISKGSPAGPSCSDRADQKLLL